MNKHAGSSAMNCKISGSLPASESSLKSCYNVPTLKYSGA